MVGIIAALGLGALALWALKGKPVAGGTPGKVQTESPIQLPSGSTPATLPGKGKTASFQVPSSKMNYWVTTWPADSNGRQFVVATAINNPGDWVSFFVNTTSRVRTEFAHNPPPRDQARRDFNFIA